MKFIIFYVSIITLCALSGISSGAAFGEHTIDEWQTILEVPKENETLTGLQLSLELHPDQYYQPVMSNISISGEVFNIFGPVDNASVTLAKGIEGEPVPFQDLKTDQNGRFSSSDTMNATGVVRYLAWYDGSDIQKTNRTISNEIEIQGIDADSPIFVPESDGTSQAPDDTNLTPEIAESDFSDNPDELGEPDDGYPTETSGDQNLTESNDNLSIIEDIAHPELPGITLEADSESFYPGQNVTFSGVVTGVSGKPRSHVRVSIEQSTPGSFTKIGDTQVTDQNGSFQVSHHFTGPWSLNFRAVSSDEEGEQIISEEIALTSIIDDLSPSYRERTDSRHIKASLYPPVIIQNESISVSGWFSDGNGDAITAGRLNLYWYNFADRIWDRYEPGADVITNHDGFYTINTSGPNVTGVSYLSMVSKHEKNGKPLFSEILPLTVRGNTSVNETVLPSQLTAMSTPPQISVQNQAIITFTLSDQNGTPIAGEPVQLYFSEDGITWYKNGNVNLTTGSEGTVTMTDTPMMPGYHYYHGIYPGSSVFLPADSGILVLPVLDSPYGPAHSDISNQSDEVTPDALPEEIQEDVWTD